MCYALNRYYGANIDAHWYIGQYVLPGNVQKIILKPKTLPFPQQASRPGRANSFTGEANFWCGG